MSKDIHLDYFYNPRYQKYSWPFVRILRQNGGIQMETSFVTFVPQLKMEDHMFSFFDLCLPLWKTNLQSWNVFALFFSWKSCNCSVYGICPKIWSCWNIIFVCAMKFYGLSTGDFAGDLNSSTTAESLALVFNNRLVRDIVSERGNLWSRFQCMGLRDWSMG